MSLFISLSQVKCEEPFYTPTSFNPFQPSAPTFFSLTDPADDYEPEIEPEVYHIDNLYIKDLIFGNTEVIVNPYDTVRDEDEDQEY